MQIVPKAVSETDDQATLYLLDGGMSSRNSLVAGAAGLPFLDRAKKTAATVASVKLDSFCDAMGLRPDVIKIDVEGAEGMVLRGASAVLRRFRPVLVLSTHPYWLPSSDSVDAMFRLLAGHGYNVKDSHVVHFEGYEIGDYLLCA
jgi:hypothetical protein